MAEQDIIENKDDNLEYEDVRSSSDMVRMHIDTSEVKKQKKERDIPDLIIKGVLLLILGYIIYLLLSGFVNYGKDGDLLIEVVQEHRTEDNTDIDRYRLYTSGLLEKVNTKSTDELGLGQTILLNLYSKTVYRFAISLDAASNEDYYHIYVFNSKGNVVKEYEGKEMILNKLITNWVYVENVETKEDLIGVD